MKIVITGPRSVGKTTISKLVAKKLDLKYISSDEIGEEITKEQGGLDTAIKSGKILEIIKDKGYTLILDVFKQDNLVFDLSGGSISSSKFPEASKEVREKAKKEAIVIGLLPSKSQTESIKILFEREKSREHFKESNKEEILEQTEETFNRFPKLFKNFCNFIIYTGNKTPEEITEKIVKKIRS